MWRKRPLGTILALGALFVLGSACGQSREVPSPAAPPPLRVVSVGASAQAWSRREPRVGGSIREPHVRYPEGTRLALEDVDGRQTPLDLNLAVAGGPEPMLDGERVLFVGKADPAEKYGIWSCRRDGSDLERVVDVNADCGRAAQLPDGRIVYSRSVSGRPVKGLRSAWALYVKARDERDGRRITFGAGLAIDPTVLLDGRILYSAWQATGGSWLWTVHPDGTGAARVPGEPMGESAFPVLPVQADDGNVAFFGFKVLPENIEAPLYLFSIDWRAPGERPEQIFEWPPLRRGRPQGYLSMVRETVPYGQVLGLGAGDGARAVRFHLLEDTGEDPPSSVLGDVPLAQDGSFFVRLPPDVPIVLETLDEDGRVIGEQKTPFWVRPNETRACVGCHEDPETAPPNRRPLAVLQDPVDLTQERD